MVGDALGATDGDGPAAGSVSAGPACMSNSTTASATSRNRAMVRIDERSLTGVTPGVGYTTGHCASRAWIRALYHVGFRLPNFREAHCKVTSSSGSCKPCACA